MPLSSADRPPDGAWWPVPRGAPGGVGNDERMHGSEIDGDR
jgi:hypothetical protein